MTGFPDYPVSDYRMTRSPCARLIEEQDKGAGEFTVRGERLGLKGEGHRIKDYSNT